MENFLNQEKYRIVSGMRATGIIHLGNYHSVLENWIDLQYKYDCFFFVADLHVLTTNYDTTLTLKNDINKVFIDWLSSGLDPTVCKIFLQSFVPEHVELYLLLSMCSPISWLNHIPTYKDKIQNSEYESLNYGFLGYPLLQAADILLYKAHYVPVGEDQISHIEFTRNIVKKFNYLYMNNYHIFFIVNNIIKKMSFKNSLFLEHIVEEYYYKNYNDILFNINEILSKDNFLSISQKNILFKYFKDDFFDIFIEPKEMLAKVTKVPGLDGKKMSKSYNNTIFLTESPDNIKKKVNLMLTDTGKKFKYSCGNVNVCSIFVLHKLYSMSDFVNFISDKCSSGKLSCKDCKKIIIDNIIKKNAYIRKNSIKYIKNPNIVLDIVKKGSNEARKVAIETLEEVKNVIGI